MTIIALGREKSSSSATTEVDRRNNNGNNKAENSNDRSNGTGKAVATKKPKLAAVVFTFVVFQVILSTKQQNYYYQTELSATTAAAKITPNNATTTRNNSPKQRPSNQPHPANTSFYLYEEIWKDFDTHCVVENPYFAKGVEPMWIKQLIDHPWRVRNPLEAVAFVVPVNFAAESAGWCKNKTGDEFAKTAASILLRSESFHRNNGTDHVVLSTYYKSRRYLPKLPSFSNMIWLERVKGRKESTANLARVRLNIMHNGPPPARYYNKSSSTTTITTTRDDRHRPAVPNRTLFFAGQADRRKAYRYRVAAIKNLADVVGPENAAGAGGEGTTRDSNILIATPCKDNEKTGIRKCDENETNGCCTGERWSHDRFMRELSKSRWNLFVGGDDAGSARFIEAVSIGVPSIVVSPYVLDEYFSFPDVIPWKDFVVVLDPQKFLTDPKRTVRDALREHDEHRDRYAKLQEMYSKEFMWSHPESNAATNALAQIAREGLLK